MLAVPAHHYHTKRTLCSKGKRAERPSVRNVGTVVLGYEASKSTLTLFLSNRGTGVASHHWSVELNAESTNDPRLLTSSTASTTPSSEGHDIPGRRASAHNCKRQITPCIDLGGDIFKNERPKLPPSSEGVGG